MKNIRSFLTSCSRDFGLTQEALFDANELFDVSDFAKVSVTLFILQLSFKLKFCVPKTFRLSFIRLKLISTRISDGIHVIITLRLLTMALITVREQATVMKIEQFKFTKRRLG